MDCTGAEAPIAAMDTVLTSGARRNGRSSASQLVYALGGFNMFDINDFNQVSVPAAWVGRYVDGASTLSHAGGVSG